MDIKLTLFLILVTFKFYGLSPLMAQSPKISQWKNFKRLDFEVVERPARLILPNQALPGNPWVWRARFPEYHSEIDSMLAAKGFHIAYINTDNLYGSPKAMAIWDKFFAHVVDQF